MGTILGSMVAGFIAYVLWPKALSNKAVPRGVKRLFIGILVAIGLVAAIAAFNAHVEDYARHWGTIGACLVFGTLLGYVWAWFLKKTKPAAAPVAVAGSLGVATLLLLAASLIDTDDLSRRLNSLDTPLIKFELSQIEPAEQVAASQTEFLSQSADPASGLAEIGAASVVAMIDRSNELVNLTKFISSDKITPIIGYANISLKKAFESTAKPIAECIRDIHQNRPGDEKIFILSNEFVNLCVSFYRSLYETNIKSSMLDTNTIRMEIGRINRLDRHYRNIYNNYDSISCEKFDLSMTYDLFHQIGINSESMNTFQFPILFSGLMSSRNFPDEATEELLKWIDTFGYRNSHNHDDPGLVRDSARILNLLQTIYALNWASIYAERSGNETNAFVSRSLLISIFNKIIDNNETIRSSYHKAFNQTPSSSWKIDGKCAIDSEVPESARIGAAIIASIYTTNSNNHLYYLWRNKNFSNIDNLNKITDKLLSEISSFDYDCFPVDQGRFALSIAETYIVIKLNQIAVIDPGRKAHLHEETCKLAQYIPAWTELQQNGRKNAENDNLYRSMPDRPIREQLEAVERIRDSNETFNLIEERLNRIRTLIVNFSGNGNSTYAKAYAKICGASQ